MGPEVDWPGMVEDVNTEEIVEWLDEVVVVCVGDDDDEPISEDDEWVEDSVVSVEPLAVGVEASDEGDALATKPGIAKVCQFGSSLHAGRDNCTTIW